DFEPWKIEYEKISDNEICLNKKDFYEYLIKYIYDKPYSWKDEMKEAFGLLTCNEYSDLFNGLFDVSYRQEYILDFFQDKWNSDIKLIEGEFPHSHILLAAKKKTIEKIEEEVLVPVQIVDTLVIGSGLAGCSAVIGANDGKGKIAMVSKGKFRDANTEYAQGGIAAVIDRFDTEYLHILDTLKAGCWLNNIIAVMILVHEGALLVNELIRWGANFDRDEKGKIKFGKEAHPSGISRIVKAGDASGSEMARVMLEQLNNIKNLSKFEEVFITELIIENDRCVGAKGIDLKTGQEIKFFAKSVVLATGGMGQIYLNNSNPTFATADGIGLANQVKALIRNMRFVQFHPTTLVIAGGKKTMPNKLFPHTPMNFLISEAVRGEGAILLNKKGERFMFNYHEKGELATRDVVSRAVWAEMTKTGSDFVWLDARGIKNFKEEFSVIYGRCIELGFNPEKEPIPIAPAAHYAMGGIATDIWGRTSISGLYAAGEVSFTGVHGANRLASNSLLEALVYGRRAGIDALEYNFQINDNEFR
ncbi:MAG: FAD-binding protein, partial [Candidatus Omnitrophica bacterium]|nr:FAD-binding protein [Candidatus Omnitrophota bacterium]